MMLSQERLKEVLDYDSETGVFTWKVGRGGRAKAGARAGSTPMGALKYRQIKIDNKAYCEHRLAWLYVYGEFPKDCLDHSDGNTENNSLKNLREATCSQNVWNSKKRTTNKSGHKGVSWCKRRGKWRACIHHANKQHHLGYFDDIGVAIKTYQVAAKKYHGEFVNHG